MQTSLLDSASVFVRLCNRICATVKAYFGDGEICVVKLCISSCVCVMCVVCVSRVTVTACGTLPGAKPYLCGALPVLNLAHNEFIHSTKIHC